MMDESINGPPTAPPHRLSSQHNTTTCKTPPQEPQGLVPEDDEEPTEGFTEVDGIIFEGDFEDDSVKPSLTSLLEDVGDDVGGDAFKLDSDDSFFSIPDYVPSELPDLAALGSGAWLRGCVAWDVWCSVWIDGRGVGGVMYIYRQSQVCAQPFPLLHR